MERVSGQINSYCVCFHPGEQFVLQLFCFTEPEVDAQVRVEGHGGSVRGGDEHRHQHPEEQPGVSARAGRQQGRKQRREAQMDQSSKVRIRNPSSIC